MNNSKSCLFVSPVIRKHFLVLHITTTSSLSILNPEGKTEKEMQYNLMRMLRPCRTWHVEIEIPQASNYFPDIAWIYILYIYIYILIITFWNESWSHIDRTHVVSNCPKWHRSSSKSKIKFFHFFLLVKRQENKLNNIRQELRVATVTRNPQLISYWKCMHEIAKLTRIFHEKLNNNPWF